MTTTFKAFSISFACLAICGFASAGEVFTATPTKNGAVVRDVPVHIAPGEVETPAGAAKLWERIKLAAHQACAPAPERRSMPDQQNYNVCVKRAAKGAVAKLNAPLVTRLAAGDNPLRLATTAPAAPNS
jgi:UrcA family protein